MYASQIVPKSQKEPCSTSEGLNTLFVDIVIPRGYAIVIGYEVCETDSVHHFEASPM